MKTVDKLKIAELALIESEKKFHFLAQSAIDTIIISNNKGKIVYWNKSAEKMFGFTEKEAIDEDLDIIIPQNHKAAHHHGMKRFQQTNIPHIIGKTVELEGIRKNKELFPLELSLSTWQSNDESFFCGIIRDISDRKQAENIIKESLAEKEVLLKEIHHRVKNNLQLVSSIISLYSSKIDDDRLTGVLMDCQNKIHSMALVHTSLYKSNDLANMNFASYINTLCDQIQDSLNKDGKIQLIKNLAPTSISINIAISCGLILSELITNSFKHAFSEGHKGIITVDLKSINEETVLSIADNGKGLKKNIYNDHPDSFGLEMVKSLVNQIDGKLELKNGQGTTFILKFKKI